MTLTHPSIGRPVEWVVVGGDGSSALAGMRVAASFEDARAQAVYLDWTTASYVAPGVKPRPHAAVVRVWEEKRGSYPVLAIVGGSYPNEPSSRPAGVEMVRVEGRLVGDAILVARCAGLVLDCIAVEARIFDLMARNEKMDLPTVVREFVTAATKALEPTTRPPTTR